MKNFSKKELRKYLCRIPPSEKDEVLVEIASLGFRDSESGGWIINPYWSDCGSFEVDPISYYGMDFLDSPIAAMLGFVLPCIVPAPQSFLKASDRLQHEKELMGRVRKSQLVADESPDELVNFQW